jgi:hypothetical protein
MVGGATPSRIVVRLATRQERALGTQSIVVIGGSPIIVTRLSNL